MTHTIAALDGARQQLADFMNVFLVQKVAREDQIKFLQEDRVGPLEKEILLKIFGKKPTAEEEETSLKAGLIDLFMKEICPDGTKDTTFERYRELVVPYVDALVNNARHNSNLIAALELERTRGALENDLFTMFHDKLPTDFITKIENDIRPEIDAGVERIRQAEAAAAGIDGGDGTWQRYDGDRPRGGGGWSFG